MPTALWSGETSRKIITRIIITGNLVLQTPVHFNSGDPDDLTDMPLLVDPLDGKTPLLTGASIAGALRSYLRAVERGHLKPLPDPNTSADKTALKTALGEERRSAVVKLFGGFRADDKGEQSSLIVDDALGKNFGIEARDGVRINPASRTAEQNGLFDFELWRAGTRFPLRLELLVQESENANSDNILKQALATALSGFNNGGITLGARKRRGYGQAQVSEWRVTTYNLNTPDGLLAWLGVDRPDVGLPQPPVQKGNDICSLLDVTPLEDARQAFTLTAVFSLDGSLLIRSGGGQDDTGPDWAHLQAQQANGELKPVVSGASLGGALRARALKVANTLDTDAGNRASELVDKIFGFRSESRQGAQPKASRVSFREKVVQGVKTDLVQNRVKIDRFTGGALDTALFNEQPAFGGDDTTLIVDLQLVNPEDHEVGLLLLLLKDLWAGDLPLGGESSVGRGRLQGRSARLSYHNGNTAQTWQIESNNHHLSITGSDRRLLEGYVKKLDQRLKGAAS